MNTLPRWARLAESAHALEQLAIGLRNQVNDGRCPVLNEGQVRCSFDAGEPHEHGFDAAHLPAHQSVSTP